MSTQDTLTETSPLNEFRYTLSKQIPAITPGAVIQTSYGDICLDQVSAPQVADVLRTRYEFLLADSDRRLLALRDELNRLLATLEYHIEAVIRLLDEDAPVLNTQRQRTGYALTGDWLLKNGQRLSDHLGEIIAAMRSGEDE